MSLQELVTHEFQARIGVPPRYVVRAPGRVNLIGEHTDYNGGYVMPIAINRAAWIALRQRPDRQIRIYSVDLDEGIEFSLDHLEREAMHWAEWLKSIAWALQKHGYQLRGWEGVLAGNVPIGAGLSSSAALQMATARAFECVSSFPWDTLTLAKIAKCAEHKWVGIKGGIMDQMTAAAGIADHALLIDCHTLAYEPVPLPQETVVVVLDTATRRQLVDTAYNDRVTESKAVAAHFGKSSLREVSNKQLGSAAKQLGDTMYRRGRHVITENARTKLAADCMRSGNAAEMGKLMDASHVSLRDDYDVSSRELNVIVDVARQQPGCFGARLTGAGFGGCAVALVDSASVHRFIEQAATNYQTVTGLQAAIYVCKASDGAEISYSSSDITDELSL